MENAVLGREVELAAVGRLLDGVAEAPRAVAIDGEAGIGKTTLWAAGVALARNRGFLVLQAQPAESEAGLSYAALADLVGDVFDATRSRLPVVQERALGASLLREEADGAAAPRTTATAVVGVLAALAEREPVLVAVDDVQWLDRASEEALAFAVRRLPARIGVLVARRSTVAADPPLGLARALPEDRLEHVVVGPLSLAGLHHLIARRLGSPLPRPLLVRVAEASGGNPFFALELARAAARDTGVGAASEPLRVPPTLEELVADRLRALSPPARESALAAAALSRPSATVVDAAVEGDGRAALLEAEEAGVLVSERDRIRFTHPLLASAIYGSAAPERRRRLHERLADLVSDPEERARHLALSATEPDAKTADVLERAAARAAGRGAPHAAAELYAAAARLTPAAQSEEQARRALGEASALLSAGDAAGARSRAEAAAESHAGSLRAEALALLGDIAWVSGSGAPHAFFEQALAAAPGDGELAARLYPKLVTVTVPFPARAVEHADAALRVLTAERHPAALASIVFERLWAAATLGHGWDLELHERWRELEEKAGPEAPKSRIPLVYFHCVDDVEAARARHAVEDHWYADRGEDLWRAERLAHLANAELRAGRIDLAERYLDEAAGAIAHVQKVGPWAGPMRFRSHVDACRGRDRPRAGDTAAARGRDREKRSAVVGGSRALVGRVRRVPRRRPRRGRRRADADARAARDDLGEGHRAGPERAVPRRGAGRARRARPSAVDSRAPRASVDESGRGSGST